MFKITIIGLDEFSFPNSIEADGLRPTIIGKLWPVSLVKVCSKRTQ